ncbi:putative cytochrome P450 monooxygenase [Dothidotthia symphoricarpi CBS 119687]|uniref:Putative cytochrome P450 monooxygenase n=1 Tax=Dothidotthia symphoricarpi CBS 119687 TaxID=1392245 RepID=A0A6A6ACY0_9PLEO|nr:putative cytochrome P450 monooxygenase [Dothidotthia symphoricarpi CBS 119687]KAF2129630.1 putative cytochrome P450 monooxygenase [Dothidotthia symphoricarpi CBS 119687]
MFNIAIGVVVLVVLLVLKVRTIGCRGKDFPPGPKTTPVLGNALDFPTSFPHVKFSEWAQTYGDIFSLKILNRTVVVISSAAAVKHILDSNGAHTGNRPRSVLVQRVTNGSLMALENMENSVWKHGRHAIHTFLTKDSLKKHLQTQQAEYTQFMHDILEDPQNIFTHICRTTASVMITLLYGSRITSYANSPAETYFRGVKLLNEVTDPGAHPPVDLFWPLQYVPKRWAYWKRLADTTRGIRDELYGSLHAQCVRAIETEKTTGCYLESLILNQEKLRMTRDEVIGMGAVMMDAGAETTASFLQSFILALINNPHVQEKGQAEIDSVVGHNRWPGLDDYENVPYIRAIADEVLRFRTILPIAIPHVNTKELHYNGYCIPENSMIFMNSYGLYHDPKFYDEPEMFDPERFIKTEFGTKEGVDVTGYRNNLAFGAGRRICPGESMARRTITLNTMNLLWAFNFKKDGKSLSSSCIPINANVNLLQPGIELAPKPFTCDAKPRSAEKEQLIRERYARVFPHGVNGETRF